MSKYLPEKRFSFISTSRSVDSETFGVVQFTGSEGISIPYEFDIMLVSDNATIDLDDMLASPVKFTIHRKNGTDVDFHGMLDSFEQLHKYGNYIFYRAHLVPRLWWLSITHHNQVCLSKTVPEIIELALKDSSLQKSDFEFKLRSLYKPISYVCQYNESHFNFISRWLEREGIYYFFDQQGPNEKIVFADTNIAHTILPDVSYIPPDGLTGKENAEILSAFICRQKQLPQKIMLKDYNYERPSLDVKGFADVDDRGKGIDYIYGESFPDSDEGNRLASIRAEIHNSRKREFIGESSVPFLSPGYIFTLQGHYRSDFNQQYLVTGITHEGNQVGYLLPGITQGLKGYENTIYYRNSFTSIPANVQYRSEPKARKSRIAGTLNATIDAEGSGQYAELDNYGRYKVRLPFDESSEHRSGKASTYLRMMQPYANQKGGMQFPLTKGTEVLLTFIDGDPDRPVIAGAIANPETPSPVTDKNQTEAVIQSGGNNRIRIEDKKGKERIIMESPTAGSWVRIGAPNDPPEVYSVKLGENAQTIIDGTEKWICESTVPTAAANTQGTEYTYKLSKTYTVLRVNQGNNTVFKINSLTIGTVPELNKSTLPATVKLGTINWSVNQPTAWNTDNTAQVTLYRTKTVRVIVLHDAVVDEDDGNGIKIKTSGKIVEESFGNHELKLIDLEFDNLMFSIESNFDQLLDSSVELENNYIEENIDCLTTLISNSSSVPDLFTKYTEEKQRLEGLKITNDEKTDMKNAVRALLNPKRSFSQTITEIKALYPSGSTRNQKNELKQASILRVLRTLDAKILDFDVKGDQKNQTSGSHIISAINGERKLELTQGGILIDAGTDDDIVLRCKRFVVKNQSEDNITYGDDNSLHYGNATEQFYGNSTAVNYGDSTEVVHGNSTSTHIGNSTENHNGISNSVFSGMNNETNLSDSNSATMGVNCEFTFSEALSVWAGAKQDISLIESFELFIGLQQSAGAGMSTEFFAGMKSSAFAGASYEYFAGYKVETVAGAKLEIGKFDEVKQHTGLSITGAILSMIL